MARLFTDHDPFHVHALLGALVLWNYVYRFFLLFRTGTAFPASESLWTSTMSILLHGLLSWSSLLLPIPTTRNVKLPMIWPEFRLHSITFATRHVVSAIISLNQLWPDDDLLLWRTVVALLIVVGTNFIASIITDHCGDREHRTTNAMPYPSTVTVEEQALVKHAYARAQFSATKACQLPDASMNFAPLIGIQMAPLLMTLVRKGKISSMTYHQVYALSLLLGYMGVLVRMVQEPTLAIMTFIIMLVPTPRLRRYFSSTMVGTIQVLFTFLVCPTIVYPTVMPWLEGKEVVVTRLAWIAIWKTLLEHYELFRPLFDNNNKTQDKLIRNNGSTRMRKAIKLLVPLVAIAYTTIMQQP